MGKLCPNIKKIKAMKNKSPPLECPVKDLINNKLNGQLVKIGSALLTPSVDGKIKFYNYEQ